MKTKLISTLCLLLIFCCSSLSSNAVNSKSNPPASGTLTVYSSPELFGLATEWAGEYSAAHPGQSIDVIKSEASGMESIIRTGNNICFISNEQPSSDKQSPVFQLVVGREIIVPVLSPKNPFLKEIFEQGISPKALASSIQVPGKMQWGTLLHNSQTEAVRFIILDDNYTKAGVSRFTKLGPTSIEGIKSVDRDALVAAVQNDPYAIGFCRLTDILNANASTFAGNLLLMPIDKNGNGKMDYMEKIYDNFHDFTRGVWIGKYPKTLTNNIYCISKTQPAGESELAFLNWVLTSGQALLQVNGFSDLVSNERQSQMDKLISAPLYTAAPKDANTTARIILLLMLVLIAVSLTLDLVIRKYRVSKIKQSGVLHGKPSVFDQQNMDIPGGLYFDKSHTWAFMEQDGTVKVGIDDFMQHITGPITSIGLRKQGLRIKKGDQLCILIQKGKQLIIHSPVTGTIIEQNLELPAHASLINESPYSEGWVYRIQPDNWSREIEFLSMADKYRKWLNNEFTRLRDFLAASLQPHSPAYAVIILQDGGELKDHVLADLGPEVWEDFQTKFINTSM